VKPFLDDGDVTLYHGDAAQVLAGLPAGSVHMCVTSPPFFGLRDYGTGEWEGGVDGCNHLESGESRTAASVAASGLDGGKNQVHRSHTFGAVCGKCGARRVDSQIGLEDTPGGWVAALVTVFHQVHRVLRDDGTLWIECGDSYVSGQGGRQSSVGEMPASPLRIGSDGDIGRDDVDTGSWWSGATEKLTPARGETDLKPKDLLGQPFMLAFALRADGWYWRGMYPWAKRNAMPESVRDRFTTAHSYVMQFAKKPRYFFDAVAVQEPAEWARWGDQTVPKHDGTPTASGWVGGATKDELHDRYVNPGNRTNNGQKPRTDERRGFDQRLELAGGTKNRRSVIDIPTEANGLAVCAVCDAYWEGGAPRQHCGQPVVQHFAAFPRALARLAIQAGTSEHGVCSECGAPWERVTETSGEWRAQHELPAKHNGEVYRTNPGGGISGRNTNRVTVSIGWRPTCAHEDAPRIPATCLDPFAGSGTTLLVAREQGRHAVGVELNQDYCRMMRARLAQLSLLG
jgi:DNA modification methylase